MKQEWRRFYRRASPNHLLEARIAADGEPYGRDDLKLKTQEGQWLCRSIENGYRWAMSKEGMVQFYFPVDSKNDAWDALVARMEKNEKKKKKNVRSAKKR